MRSLTVAAVEPLIAVRQDRGVVPVMTLPALSLISISVDVFSFIL